MIQHNTPITTQIWVKLIENKANIVNPIKLSCMALSRIIRYLFFGKKFEFNENNLIKVKNLIKNITLNPKVILNDCRNLIHLYKIKFN